MNPYEIPLEEVHSEIRVLNSRFIASLAPAFSVEQAREFIRSVKNLSSDATHHVPAFIIGHGSSQTSHCSDDGEPSGTAGRPALAVLSGSGLGDVVVVVTRYFGGTKLGTGGLVRAYGDAVRSVLAVTQHARKVMTASFHLAAPYHLYERLQKLLIHHQAVILDQNFSEIIRIEARLPSTSMPLFDKDLSELTAGGIVTQIFAEEEIILPVN